MLPAAQGPRRAVLAGIVAAIAVLVGGGAVVEFRSDTSWRAMQQEAAALQASWHARSHRRTPLSGTGTDDRAFLHYERAMALAQELVARDPARLQVLLRCETVELRTQWQPVLAALHAGAQATDLTLPAANVFAADRGRWIAHVAVCDAQALRHAGHGRAAVQRTLDAASLGADLLRHGTLLQQVLGGAIVTIATSAAWSEAAIAELDREALDMLATGLERLDRALPDTPDATGELLGLARSWQRPGEGGWSMPTTSAWRFGFSARWMLADAFAAMRATARDLEQSRELAWPARAALLAIEQDALAESGNPLLPLAAGALGAAERDARAMRTQLRLLRMSIDLHRGRDVPPLPDPLGDGPLRVRHTSTGVRLHSAAAEQNPSLARDVLR
jgi:hypothetical protein